MIGHVNEPLYPEGVDGGHKVQGDPGRHEERHDDPVGGVGGARPMLASVPLTPVKQAGVLVGQQELLLKYDILFVVNKGFKYYLINVNHSNMNERTTQPLNKLY